MSLPAEGILVIRRFACALVAALSVVVAVGIASPANASNAGSFIAQINADRAKSGRAAFTPRADLADLALRHSQTMAAENSLRHNPNLVTQVSNWQAVGENVGMGGNTRVLHAAFMNSPAHRANILDRDFTEVGLGVTVDARGVMWVTEVFRRPLRTVASARGVAARPGRQSVAAIARPSTGGINAATRRSAAVRWAVPRTRSTSPRAARSTWLTRLAEVFAR